jgi:glycosyltransferase involved in cell wall biosynthesis
MLLPYVSRLGVARNAGHVALRVRRVVGDLPVVLHCRGEAAGEWAAALAPRLGRAGIVLDVRGAWPEELLLARGYDGPEGADAESLAAYRANMARLRDAIAASGALLAVSPVLADWLAEQGADRSRVTCVPCCVSGPTFSPQARAEVRASLGVESKTVFAYLGTITRYQHIEDGLVPFFREVLHACPAAHLLCITDAPGRMRELAVRGGIPPSAVATVAAAQEDVPRFLSAADCGVLLRAASRVNRVSMPVKLAEYLAGGVPLLVTRFAPWTEALVQGSGAGVVVDVVGADAARLRGEAARACQALAERGPAMRERALALCARQFVWSQYTQQVRDAYALALRSAGLAPAHGPA